MHYTFIHLFICEHWAYTEQIAYCKLCIYMDVLLLCCAHPYLHIAPLRYIDLFVFVDWDETRLIHELLITCLALNVTVAIFGIVIRHRAGRRLVWVYNIYARDCERFVFFPHDVRVVDCRWWTQKPIRECLRKWRKQTNNTSTNCLWTILRHLYYHTLLLIRITYTHNYTRQINTYNMPPPLVHWHLRIECVLFGATWLDTHSHSVMHGNMSLSRLA